MIGKASLATFLFVAMAAYSADQPREFSIAPELIKDPPAFLTQVVVPDANCAAVNAAASLLVVGCRSEEGKHLAIFHLDAAGQPTGEPAWVALPKPEVLAKKANYALGVLFHPRLPVLYVWQDVAAPPPLKEKEKAPNLTDYAEFDHLLTYAIKDGALELVQTGARGPGFHCGLNAGTIGLDFELKNLFVPNAQGETYDEAGIGFYALDEEGVPGDTPEAGANDKPGRKPEMTTNVSKSPNKKAIRVVVLPKKLRTNHYFPSGAGWFAGSEAMLMGGYSGCLVADFHNGSLRQTWFGLADRTGPCSLAGHPTLPAAYLCLQDYNQLVAIGHANGYLSLLPQVATVPGAHFIGTPVVLTKQSRVAIGDTKALHFLSLRADGKIDNKDELLKLPCAYAKGLAYSEKNDRLYVAVDKAN